MITSETELLHQLKKGSSKAFESLYQNHYRMVAALITRMGGDQNDVEDIFQETLFVLVKNIRRPEFKLSSKISTYMHAISRNLWLKKGQKGKKEINMPDEELLNLSFFTEPEDNKLEQRELMIGVLFDKINALEDDCKKVIKLTFLKKLSHKEVAEILGYTLSFIKVKKFRCLKSLRKMVSTSPFFQA